MTIKAFSEKDVDFTKQHMFFGEQPNVARYDVQRYPIFNKLIERQLGFFWQPEEIDVTKDNIDFKQLSDHEKHIFMSNLKYQLLLDSIQSRSVSLALLPFVSLPELESLIEIWSAIEMIHNRSYEYILQNILSNPSIVFDDIIRNTDIINRAQGVTKYYDDFMDYGQKFHVLGEGKHQINGEKIVIKKRELKRKLLLCVASVNILEGARFYASFACSFAFAEKDLMEGNAKIISLIARDENLHLAITQNILKKWAAGEDDPEMKELYEEEIETIKNMYYDAVSQEKAWAEYLFKDGSMMGLNDRILQEYIEYITGKRMRAIGIKNEYSKKNPLSWTDKYLRFSDKQDANQEVDNISYTTGGVTHDVTEDTFADIKF